MLRKIQILILLFFGVSFSNEIEWVYIDNWKVDATDKLKIIRMAETLNISNIYQIQIGKVSHFHEDKGLIVKGIKNCNDSIQYEKHLYIWSYNMRPKEYYSRNYNDSSLVDFPFYSGRKNIRDEKRYVYVYKDRRKVFDIVGHDEKQYREIKVLLDCLMDGKISEENREYAKQTEKIWNAIKADYMAFQFVWGKANKTYDFQYCLFEPICKAPKNLIDGANDATLRIKLDNDEKCQIIYAGPGGGSR